MATHYASLVGPLLGLYYPLPPNCETDEQRRLALATSKLKHLWCAIYTEAEVDDQVKHFGVAKLPDSFSRKLDYDYDQVFPIRKED